MSRPLYLDLAEAGHCLPIGTHLVLHEHEDAGQIILDGPRLGEVVAETARRFASPLAIPLMDLTLEKDALLRAIGVPPEGTETFHFAEPPPEPGPFRPTLRMEAACHAIATVAKDPSLVPIGMGIGPFSLTTKLMEDPITPVFLAGSGLSAIDEPDVAFLEQCLQISSACVLRYLTDQIDAGAKALIVCEPAANQVYFSPNQLASSFEIFDRCVTQPLRLIAELCSARNVDFILHDCGELTNGMLERLAGLEPAMLSLGSSRLLWEDAALVPKSTVLYGNLPSKRFFSPQLTVKEVESSTAELLSKMRAAGHPFILGTECDVLSVPGAEDEILAKIEAMTRTAAKLASARPPAR